MKKWLVFQELVFKYFVAALVADGFSAEPYFECYVASKENSEGLAGFALYYYAFPWNGKTVYLEDLYVCPEYRSKGVGSKLWKAVVQVPIIGKVMTVK